MEVNQRRQGNAFEQIAADFLIKKGYSIKKINFYCKIGEIDIIAKDNDYLVFVEVKYRKNRNFGSPFEAVNFSKMKKICRASDYYRLINNLTEDVPVRFDVIGISEGKLEHFVNAFEYIV